MLVLDGVQDPGNLGTLIRTAAAFRWDAVCLMPGCCDPFNDKVPTHTFATPLTQFTPHAVSLTPARPRYLVRC